MKTEDALAIIDSFKSERPGAYRLALAASLAVRVEPELVRALRLGVVREADAGAEADLWFSPLVESQTPLALEFDPAVQELLRRALAEDPELLRGAWEVVESFHSGAPYALRLEEELTWLGLTREDNRALIEERLGAALARLRAGRDGIARWAARALPSLPPKARTTNAAAVLSLAAGLRTGVGPVLEAVPNRVPEEGWLSEFASGTISRVKVGVRLLKDVDARAAEEVGEVPPAAASPEPPMQVELSYPPALGAEVVEVPDTYRLLLELSWEAEGGGRRLRQLSLLPDERRRVPVEYGDVTIRTALGDLFVIRPHFDYDFLILYYAGDGPWVKDLADRLSAQTWNGKPLRVTSAPFNPSFKPGKEFEELRRKFGLSRKVGLVGTDAQISANFITQLGLSRPEPPGRGDWLICLLRGGDWKSPHSARLIDFHTQPLDQAFRELWHAITGEDLPPAQEPATQTQPTAADGSQPPQRPAGEVGNQRMPQRPPKLFISYAREDEEYKNQLVKHLKGLAQQGVIASWHDGQLVAGQQWNDEIVRNLGEARVLLLLISPSFISSDYVSKVELAQAGERYERGEVSVIPVLIRNVHAWESKRLGSHTLGSFQALPRSFKFVVDWPNRDAAFAEIAAEVEDAVQALEPLPEAAGPLDSIPAPPSFGFVPRAGRDGRDIIERLREELSPQSRRLVALWGAGGVGKTTLAAEAVRTIAATTGQRVIWVTADGRPNFTFTTLLDDIAAQLDRTDLRPLAAGPKEEAVRALLAAAPALLVLDEFETIPPEEGALCLEFLSQRAQCPALITTRQRVEGALLIPLNRMADDEAGKFLDRLVAQTQDPDIYTEDVRSRILETAEFNPFVVQWVVGQIDLAQSPDEVLSELSQGEGHAAERVFDRSFNLKQMEDGGRAVLLALSLFKPSGTRPMVGEVAGMNLDKKRDKERFKKAQQTLASLRLIEQTPDGQRLAVAGVTRDFAKARLSRDPRAKPFRQRFVSRFARYAETHKEPTAANLNALEAERDNLLGALDEAYATQDWKSVLRISDALDSFLRLRGYWDEAVRGGEMAEASARQLNDVAGAARAKVNVAVIHKRRGQFSVARSELSDALMTFREMRREDAVSATLRHLAGVALETNEFEEAQRLYSESLEISRRLGDQHGVADTLLGLGDVTREQGELEQARRFYSESLGISKRLGDRRGTAGNLNRLALLALSEGKAEEARSLYNEGLEISEGIGDQYGVAINLQGLGSASGHSGDLKEAQRYFEKSLAVYRGMGAQKDVALVLHQMSRLAESQGDREEALRLAREALRILERLQSPGVEVVRRTLANLEGGVS